jgi:1-deoxy-D-xylulose 5-phosphate reductoisomerase
MMQLRKQTCTHARTHTHIHTQIRQFQPKLVAIKDSSKVAELKELIKDVPRQPEILVSAFWCQKIGECLLVPED